MNKISVTYNHLINYKVLTYNVTLICFIYFDDNNKKKMD